MDTEAKMIVDDVVSFCKRDGCDPRLANMLGQSIPTDLDDRSLSLEAPSRFAYSYLLKNRETIEKYLEESAFTPLELEVLPPSHNAPADGSETPSFQAETPRMAEDPVQTASGGDGDDPALTRGEAPAAFPRLDPRRTAEGEGAGVSVTNTISANEFKRLMHEGRSAESHMPSSKTGASRTEVRPREHAAASKFTFENFVYGNENKLAYISAARFAAMADDPEGNTSLFIYGNSGLGKTHLLLAIKNYLTEHKPHLRVKYANSQAYIDDYINELRLQKTENRAIMREYHDADILIIDDIQNIIGKTASIEYFFQLMDEFIRSSKKIAIASDRAPKNLGMDERLTSRFNAGSLCLVSEPSFEMKLEILRRYYENTVLREAPAVGYDVDQDSLLMNIQTGGGTLTDEQLDHMARVSGTNIRELESFCERCAGESFEREQEGKTLNSEDIDRIANEYFDIAHKRIRVDTVQKVVEDYYRVNHEDLIGPRRTANILLARHVAVYLALELCEMTTTMVGAAFGGRDHSTVLNSIKVIEKKVKGDRGLYDDLQQLREKIRIKS